VARPRFVAADDLEVGHFAGREERLHGLEESFQGAILTLR
jgi:hypothetical protein